MLKLLWKRRLWRLSLIKSQFPEEGWGHKRIRGKIHKQQNGLEFQHKNMWIRKGKFFFNFQCKIYFAKLSRYFKLDTLMLIWRVMAFVAQLSDMARGLLVLFFTVRGLSEYVVKANAITFPQMLLPNYFVTRSFFFLWINIYRCNC